MHAKRKASVVAAAVALIVGGGAALGSLLDHDTTAAQARTGRPVGNSFSVYTAGLTPGSLDLQALVRDKLRTDPGARPAVLSVLSGMLKQLKAGKRVVVPEATNRAEAIAEVAKAISLARGERPAGMGGAAGDGSS